MVQNCALVMKQHIELWIYSKARIKSGQMITLG